MVTFHAEKTGGKIFDVLHAKLINSDPVRYLASYIIFTFGRKIGCEDMTDDSIASKNRIADLCKRSYL